MILKKVSFQSLVECGVCYVFFSMYYFVFVGYFVFCFFRFSFVAFSFSTLILLVGFFDL